jgi:hypothetical protein
MLFFDHYTEYNQLVVGMHVYCVWYCANCDMFTVLSNSTIDGALLMVIV